MSIKMLYKYFTDKRTDVLENLEIRFTQPAALNDPFESRPLIQADKDKTEIIDDIKKGLENLWNNAAEEDKTAENYQSLVIERERLIKTAHKKFNPHHLGSSLSFYVNQHLGILSLSRNPTNLLMWSHYANDHKGYVLGFNASHHFFYEKTFDGSNTSPRNVIYTSQRSVINKEDKDLYEKLFCEKPVDWAYEEEVRIFRVFSKKSKAKGKDSSGFRVYLADLPSGLINSIYIGARANNNFKKKIKEIVKRNNLNARIYSSKISKAYYKVDFTPIQIVR